MSNGKLLNGVLYGIIFALVIAAVIIFPILLISNKTTVFWICLVATIVGIASIGIAILLSRNSDRHVSMNYAFLTIAWIYFILNIIATILFLFVITSVPVIWCSFTHIILLLIYIILTIGLVISRRAVEETDAKSKTEVVSVNEMIETVESTIATVRFSESDSDNTILTELIALENDLKYSDPTTSDKSQQIESDIRIGIYNLKNEIISADAVSFDETAMISKIKKLRVQIEERNRIVKLYK